MLTHSPTDDVISQVSASAVELRRRVLSDYFYRRFDGKIQHGPLKGFSISDAAIWGPGDVAAKLFGLYEQEVLDIIESASARKTHLVNLGAADGYYGVGLVATQHFARAACYEVSDDNRVFLAESARKNSVADRVHIFTVASNEFPRQLNEIGFPAEECFVLCDVEGNEFAIFDEECLAALRGSEIVIELHDFLHKNGAGLVGLLLQRAERNFTTRIVKTGYRNLSGIPDLELLADSDRWLVCSEGRPRLMGWLHLTPK